MSYVRYVRWGAIASIFAVLFIPFVVGDGGINWGSQPLTYIPFFNMFFPYITGKNFLFRIVVEIALILYIVLALKRPEYRPRASHIGYALGALIVWMALATLLSADPTKSLWSNFERMEGYIGLLHLFIFFVVAGSILSTEKLWDRFFTTSVGASAYMGFLALLQVLGHLPISSQSGARADTTFGNATYLAVYMLIHFFITLYLVSRGNLSRTAQALYGIALVLQGLGIYYTQTRGALLGLVGGLIIAALYIAVRGGSTEYRTMRSWAFGALVGIVLLGGLFVALRDTPLVQSSDTLARLASISLDDPTTRSRLFNIWPMAVQGALERPLSGWGQESFSYIFNKYYRPEMYDQEAWFDRAHNQFLDYLVAGGIPAFLLYTALYLLAGWAIIRSTLNLPQQAALIGLLAAYAFNNMFVFDNLGSAIFFMVLLAFTHSLSRRDLPATVAYTTSFSDRTIAVTAPLVALVILVGGWSVNAPGIARAKLLSTAVNSEPSVALKHYHTLIQGPLWPHTPLGFQEAAEQFMQFAMRVVPSREIEPSLRDETIEGALAAGESLLRSRPADARIELFLSTTHKAAGNGGSALEYARDAVTHSPDKQQLLFNLGGLQIESGDTEAALKTFEKTLRLAPEYDLAHIMYAGANFYAGNTAEGDRILREKFGKVVFDDDQLLHTYMNVKMYDRAAAIWQLRIDANPQDPQLLVRQAEVYLKAGNKPKAYETLRKISVIRPTAAKEVEDLIKQIDSGLINF